MSEKKYLYINSKQFSLKLYNSILTFYLLVPIKKLWKLSTCGNIQAIARQGLYIPHPKTMNKLKKQLK